MVVPLVSLAILVSLHTPFPITVLLLLSYQNNIQSQKQLVRKANLDSSQNLLFVVAQLICQSSNSIKVWYACLT